MKMPKIRVHYSIFFLVLISLFTDNLFKILVILLCIIIHEFAHFIALSYYKKQLVSIEISLIGGMMNADKEGLSLKAKLIVNLSGVFANLLIIIGLQIFNFNQPFLISYNLLMIIFNLIPIIPLDGYQVLNDILLSVYEEEFTFVIIKSIDIICLIILGIILLWLKIYGLFFIWLFLIYKLYMYNLDDKKLKKYFLLYRNT